MSIAASVLAKPSSPARDGLPLSAYRFSVEQYHRMIETGVLCEENRVELLNGWIVEKMTHNPPHDTSVDLAHAEIARLLPKGWRVRVQSAITLSESEPEPDLAVVRGPARRYAKSHPGPKDIGLLVEVAETTLLEDREVKAPIYARARVPVYWIINLPERQVEVYAQPQGGRTPEYRRRQDYGINESVPLLVGGRELGRIPVGDLLP